MTNKLQTVRDAIRHIIENHSDEVFFDRLTIGEYITDKKMNESEIRIDGQIMELMITEIAEMLIDIDEDKLLII
jgi:competence protein ComGF